MWVVAIGIVVSMMAGYIALGRFIAHQVVLTGYQDGAQQVKWAITKVG